LTAAAMSFFLTLLPFLNMSTPMSRLW
jgi:hypothetical protein